MELKPTEFRQGVKVITAEDDPIGTLDRVVIDPRNEKITDIVIKTGGLLSTDKIIPIDRVQSATEDQIILLPGTNIDTLQDYEASYFYPAYKSDNPDHVTTTEIYPVYWYPPVGSPAGYPMFVEPYGQVETVHNIPEGTVALKEGTKIYDADGQHIGDVKRIFSDPNNNRMTHILMEHGLLTKEKKLIPVNWIMEIKPDRVNLAVGSQVLDRVKAYQE